uniref:Uncharacterized protein n=1 Tax=Cucumis melo TaxID=3656 RepID=A0A9I9E8T2_CUCME
MNRTITLVLVYLKLQLMNICAIKYCTLALDPSYVVEYKVDAYGRFIYFFVALSASISGW